MKNYTFLKVISAVLCLVFTISCAACANVPELDTSGRTVIYAPSFDGTNDMPTPDAGNVTPSADTAETTAQQTADTVYSFLAAGDNIIHEAIFTDAHKRAENGVGYNFKPMYDGVADMISSADIAFVNQEGPIAGASFGVTGYPMFNAPDSAGDTLVELGFDIVNIANNHMLDKWESGLYHTIEYWKTKDVLLLGAFTETDYDNIRVYTCPDGTKISFLSYTYGTNDMKLDSDKYDMFVPLIDERDIVRQIGLAHEAGDMVFVSIHWGTENSFDPTGYTETPLYEDRAKVSQVIVYQRKECIWKDAPIRLFGNRIELGDMVLPFEDISTVAVLGRNKLNIYYKDQLYQLKSHKRFNALKYVNLFYRSKNIMRGDSDGKFLGL